MALETQQVVITGGNGSLGSALANAFRESGDQVDAPGRRELDVTDPAAVSRYFDCRSPDLLICNAGIARDQLLARLKPAAWEETWSVNFQAALACARAVLPGMEQRGGGHVIFISSHSALHPPVGQSAYATAKAALLGLATDLATDHGPAGIRVNAILPGFLETRMTAGLTPERRAKVLAAHALGRFNTCRNAASFACFLHHQLPHTSGQAFQLDSRPMVS